MGRPLHAWQCTNLSKVVRHFHKMVHWYSSAKEGVLFPWMSRLMGMPMQLSALHADLMADLNKMRDMCVAQLQPNMDISACQVGARVWSPVPCHIVLCRSAFGLYSLSHAPAWRPLRTVPSYP